MSHRIDDDVVLVDTPRCTVTRGLLREHYPRDYTSTPCHRCGRSYSSHSVTRVLPTTGTSSSVIRRPASSRFVDDYRSDDYNDEDSANESSEDGDSGSLPDDYEDEDYQVHRRRSPHRHTGHRDVSSDRGRHSRGRRPHRRESVPDEGQLEDVDTETAEFQRQIELQIQRRNENERRRQRQQEGSSFSSSSSSSSTISSKRMIWQDLDTADRQLAFQDYHRRTGGNYADLLNEINCGTNPNYVRGQVPSVCPGTGGPVVRLSGPATASASTPGVDTAPGASTSASNASPGGTTDGGDELTNDPEGIPQDNDVVHTGHKKVAERAMTRAEILAEIAALHDKQSSMVLDR